MLVLYLNIFFSFIGIIIIGLPNSKTIRLLFFYFLCIYILLISSLQTSSMDGTGYIRVYRHEDNRIEPIYQAINDFFYGLGIPYRGFTFLQGIVSSLLLFLVINKFSKDKILTLLIYINMWMPLKQLTQIRNFIAILLLFLCFYFFIKRKYLQSIVNIIIGTGIHYSSLTGISIFASYNKTIYKCIIFLTCISCLFLFIPLAYILPYNILEKIMPAYYISWLQTQTYMGRTLFHVTRFLLLFIIGLYFLNKGMDKYDKMVFLVFMFGMIIRFSFSQFGNASLRISDVFDFSAIFLIPNVLVLKQSRKYIYFYKIIAILYSFLLFGLFIKNQPEFLTSTRFVL